MAAKKKINKKQILVRLVDLPRAGRRMFYMREMKILNTLCERYSLEFMNVMTFKRKVDSMAYFACEALRPTMDQKFRAFNFKVDKSDYPTYNIHNKRFGRDVNPDTTKLTIKNFLDE
jgi:hypothetical protein|tara:strand:+ start:422 stop:772 length:351 start_codon:yes stop_codon:yes gene_type:complete